MASHQPLWLKGILRFERAIGVPIESAVRSDAYFDAVARATRAQAFVANVVENASREWLHLFNLPAESDVRTLREQLARMDRRLMAISKELADRDGR